ncbi:hypothetical protein TRVL_08703 [Trypanosoma vivax]|nr:hypothetical protein TRVL_08703 [Trypanosoma vivax]
MPSFTHLDNFTAAGPLRPVPLGIMKAVVRCPCSSWWCVILPPPHSSRRCGEAWKQSPAQLLADKTARLISDLRQNLMVSNGKPQEACWENTNENGSDGKCFQSLCVPLCLRTVLCAGLLFRHHLT